MQSIPATGEPLTRKPGSSIYYGVRFRPDLNKWVAEIRVAEWKSVDKKVWLGTFDTEQGAARGVDLARKLLKCTKKHPYNLPCDKLDAYSGQIPSHLVLIDVTTANMFKSATLFIKRECQQYAASFDAPTVPPTPHHHASQSHFQQTPPPLLTTRNIHRILATGLDSGLLDTLATEYSNSESCIMLDQYTGAIPDDITIDDYYLDDSCSSFDQTGDQTGDQTTMQTTSHMGTSPTGSSTSTLSCVTFDPQCRHDVPELEMRSNASLIAGFGAGAGAGDDGSVMTTSTTHGMELAGNAASQECWPEDSLYHYTLPTPVSASAFATPPAPDLHYGMTSYVPYMDGNYIAPMDCDELSFQECVHFPFQHNLNGWC